MDGSINKHFGMNEKRSYFTSSSQYSVSSYPAQSQDNGKLILNAHK